MLTFIDFFAGIGGFRRGMELAGHKCVGSCEFDKFALASYTAMHLMTDGDRERIAALPKNRRVAEAGKEEYRHGEWYANDVRRIFAEDIPRADCWCFGFPCQDISVAGKQAGFRGNRSSLFFRIIRLINDLEEKDRPMFLFIENVKNILSVNRGYDFLAVLSALDESGYDAEWQVINSAGYVPQNRERVFILGHLRGRCTREVFPLERADGENTILQVENYLPTKKRENPNQGRIYDTMGIAPCLNQMGGGGREPYVALPAFCDMSYGKGLRLADKACCLQARYNKGVCSRPRETSGVVVIAKVSKSQDGKVFDSSGISQCLSAGHNNTPKIAIPVLTPERAEKRQTYSGFAAVAAVWQALPAVGQPSRSDRTAAAEGGYMGRRFKENDEPMFTLTAQDRHGVMIGLPDGGFAYAVWHEEYGGYVSIRRLTPRECFRLQGWEDVYFERAALVNSDSQLYKQAGNGVTVPVVRAIAERMGRE